MTMLERFEKHIPDLTQNISGVQLIEKLLMYVPRIDFDEEARKNYGIKSKNVKQQEKEEQEKMIERILAPILNQGENKFAKMFFQKHGCKCVNLICEYKYLKNTQKHRILNTLFFPKSISYVLAGFKNTVPVFKNLKLVVEDKQKAELVAHLQACMEKCVDKELLNQVNTHGFFDYFTQLAGEEKLRGFLEANILPLEGMTHLLATKQGTDAVVRLLGFFSAKNKKAFVKLLKGKVPDMAKNSVNYLLLARLLLTVDDTVLVQKQVFNELFTREDAAAGGSVADETIIEEVISSAEGRKAILPAFAPVTKSLFSGEEFALLDGPAPTALKDPKRRREELQKSLKPHVRRVLSAFGYAKAMQTKGVSIFAVSLAAGDAEIMDQLVSELAALDAAAWDENDLVRACVELIRFEEGAAAGAFWEKFVSNNVEKLVTRRGSQLIWNTWKDEAMKETVKPFITASADNIKKAVAAAKQRENAPKEFKGAQVILKDIAGVEL